MAPPLPSRKGAGEGTDPTRVYVVGTCASRVGYSPMASRMVSMSGLAFASGLPRIAVL